MLRFRLGFALTTTLVSALLTVAAQAENWSHWRGPHFNGSADASDLPTDFSKTENVRWRAAMPGPAAATPIVHGDRVLVSAAVEETETLVAMCLDRDTGEVLWRHKAGSGYQKDDRSNYAGPSPVTDGERAFFYYGNGDLVAYRMDGGAELWRRNIQRDYGEFAILWTYSTSPTLHDGKLLIQVLQRDVPVRGRGRKNKPNRSYLLALDPKTGEQIYRHIRPSKAKAESREAFSTPIPHVHNGREQIIIAGGDAISGHRPDTGEEIWRWGTWNPDRIGHWRLVASPVAGGGVAVACAPKGGPVVAVELGGEGDLSDDRLAWTSPNRDVTSDVATPLYYNDRFYVLKGEGNNQLSCIDPQSGELIWQKSVPSKPRFRASPTGADGKVWLLNHAGEVFIYDADSGKLAGRVEMGAEHADRIRSTIAAAGDELFIRTNESLYCVGK